VGATSPEAYLLGQGVLGVTVVVLGLTLAYVFRAWQSAVREKDTEIRALHEKISGDVVPLLTRALIALERRRG
jgi:hypothetical protein